MNKFIKNTVLSVIANLFSAFITGLITLIIPKLIGVTDYGFLQYFIMLMSFGGFFHFGLISGFHVKYSGLDYDEINKGLFAKQFKIFVCGETLVSLVGIVISVLFVKDVDKKYIFVCYCLAFLFSNLKQYGQYILLATSRIKPYSVLLIVERSIYLVGVALLLLCSIKSYKYYIVVEIATQIITLIIYINVFSDVTIKKGNYSGNIFAEIKENLKIGFNVTSAEAAAIFMLALPRILIENHWDIETFGQISISLSLASVVSVFINALSFVLFPTLKQKSKAELVELYGFSRNVFDAVSFIAISMYYPLSKIICLWLPNYAQGIKFLVLFMPICVFSSKSVLLLNNYLKSIRYEKVMFAVEISSLVIIFILEYITIYKLSSLTMAIVSILIVFVIRSVLVDIIISNVFKLSFIKCAVKELLLTIIFVVIFWEQSSWLGFFLYLAISVLLNLNGIIEFVKKMMLE